MTLSPEAREGRMSARWEYRALLSLGSDSGVSEVDLNRLGMLGWELVAVAVRSGVDWPVVAR